MYHAGAETPRTPGRDGPPEREAIPDMAAPPQAAIAEALDRYRLGPVIGRGATATVHRAWDLETRSEVAVKIVPALANLDAVKLPDTA